jgi:hypothetical protein
MNKFTDKIFLRKFNVFVNEKSTLYSITRRLSDEVPVDSSWGGVEKMFKTLVRQSHPGSNEQVQRSFCRDKSIKVVIPKAWFYYTPRTKNFMNYYCGKKYKKTICRDI